MNTAEPMHKKYGDESACTRVSSVSGRVQVLASCIDKHRTNTQFSEPCAPTNLDAGEKTVQQCVLPTERPSGSGLSVHNDGVADFQSQVFRGWNSVSLVLLATVLLQERLLDVLFAVAEVHVRHGAATIEHWGKIRVRRKSLHWDQNISTTSFRATESQTTCHKERTAMPDVVSGNGSNHAFWVRTDDCDACSVVLNCQ